MYEIRYRKDAQGYVACYAGQVASTQPLTYDEAIALRNACPNGSQMEVVPTATSVA